MKNKKSSLFCLIIFLFIQTQAQALQVSKIKGNKALIDLEGAELNPGEEFYLINPETGKKTALVKIEQIKNGKALAVILKQKKPSAGDTLEAKSGSNSAMSAPVSEDGSTPKTDTNYESSLISKKHKDSWGLLLEMISATMKASFTRPTPTVHTANTDMAGSSYGIGGFYNYIYKPNISFFGEASYQPFQASGSTTLTDCDSTTTCQVSITYLSFYGSGRYYLYNKNALRFWAGAGFGFLWALSKSSSVLNASQITSNQVLSLSLGGDYVLNKKNYLTYGIDYSLFPTSSSVTANMMILKLGYGWTL